MPRTRCPGCNTVMAVHTEDLGTKIDCENCGELFRAKRDRDEDELENQERERRTNRTAWIIACVVLVLLGIPCLACVGFLIYVNTAKVGFDKPWVTASLTAGLDGNIASASFPATPASNGLEDDVNTGDGAWLVYDHMERANSVSEAFAAIGDVGYDTKLGKPLEQTYLPLRSGIQVKFIDRALSQGNIARESRSTFCNYPMREIEYSRDDGSFIMRVIHITDAPKSIGTRMVVVVAGGVGIMLTDRDKLLQSVAFHTK